MPDYFVKTAIRRGIKAGFQRAGLEVSRERRQVGAVDAMAQIARLTGCSNMLDIGANEGEFVYELRRQGYNGKVLSFEPRVAAYARLEQRAARDPLWRSFRAALGPERGEVAMNISANGVSSSVLPMEELHIDAAPDATYVATEEVPQYTLDELLPSQIGDAGEILMKLDVQGYEASVLAGAQETLKRTLAIQVELSLGPVYDGQSNWREMTDKLSAVGFQLWALEPVLADRHTGRTLQVDAVLQRRPVEA